MAAVLICAAVLLFLAAPARAAFPGFNGKFVWDGLSFAQSNGRNFETWGDNGDDQFGHWSPDGTKLVFSYPGNEDPPLYHGATSNPDGTGFQPLGASMADPSWSPDGSKIVFYGGVGGNISVINADGTGRVQLTSGAADFRPAWSPDGTKIAFDRDPGSGNRDIYVMNTDGTNITRLTTDPATDFYPNWSPDGSKLAFARITSCPPLGGYCTNQIYVMNTDGSNQTALTSDGTNYGPVWSPDGTKIAFGHAGGTAYPNGTYTMNPDGTNRQFLLPIGAPSDWQPCTSPCPPPAPPSYDTPRWAGSLRVSLVPNFRQTISTSQCQARGGTPSTHGAPLSLPSCNPPGFVPGTEAHMGNAVTGSSYVSVYVKHASVGPTNNADVNLDSVMTDIVTSTGADYLPDPQAVDVRAVIRIRLTDTNNGSSHTTPATVQDFDLSVPEVCGPVAQPGAFCSFGTSMNALRPGTFQDHQNNVLQLFRVRMYDCGPDGVHGNADDRIFATQGIYVP